MRRSKSKANGSFKSLVDFVNRVKIKDVNKLLMIKGVYDMSKVLFVDDLLDSGLTIDQIKTYVPNSRWATLADKKGEVEYTTIEMFNDDRWIVFPWENKENELKDEKEYKSKRRLK